MTIGDKSKYTDKQKRKAQHIKESYEEQGISEQEAKKRAWATINKTDGEGEKVEMVEKNLLHPQIRTNRNINTTELKDLTLKKFLLIFLVIKKILINSIKIS